MNICAIQFEKKTYHCNEVVISIWVFFEPHDDLSKTGVELHNPVEVLLVVLINSAWVVSIYLSSREKNILICVFTRQSCTHSTMKIHKRADGA
jgi:hypothetical protein